MAKDKQENNTADISKSKAKREERRKEVAKDRRQKRISKIISIAVAAVLAAVVIIAAGKMVYLSALLSLTSVLVSQQTAKFRASMPPSRSHSQTTPTSLFPLTRLPQQTRKSMRTFSPPSNPTKRQARTRHLRSRTATR